MRVQRVARGTAAPPTSHQPRRQRPQARRLSVAGDPNAADARYVVTSGGRRGGSCRLSTTRECRGTRWATARRRPCRGSSLATAGSGRADGWLGAWGHPTPHWGTRLDFHASSARGWPSQPVRPPDTRRPPVQCGTAGGRCIQRLAGEARRWPVDEQSCAGAEQAEGSHETTHWFGVFGQVAFEFRHWHGARGPSRFQCPAALGDGRVASAAGAFGQVRRGRLGIVAGGGDPPRAQSAVGFFGWRGRRPSPASITTTGWRPSLPGDWCVFRAAAWRQAQRHQAGCWADRRWLLDAAGQGIPQVSQLAPSPL